MNDLQNLYAKAKKEGRLCSICHWIVTVKDYKKGFTTCDNCRDAAKGVNCKYGHWQNRSEPVDMSGEM